MFRKLILISAFGVLAGCSDPLAGLDRLGDVDLADANQTAAALPTENEIAREGFFGTDAATGQETVQAPVVTPAPAAKPRGLLGLFRRPAPAKTDTQQGATALTNTDAAGDETDPEADVQVASLSPEPQGSPARRGLFGRAIAPAGKPRTGPDARDVPYGTLLPYGEVARVCTAKGQDLGQKVEKAPARGYALYDSNPGTAGARTWYITGFDDGCPRQLTAANVLLGSASLYEMLHFGPGGENLPYGATDKAYEGVKRRICGARKGRPCGSKISRMENSTFFVSAYASFGNVSRWSELLIHDGAVLAAALKTNG